MGKIDKKSLIEFFRVESEEHFEIIMNALHTLMGDIENWSLLDEIFRSAHTIKGSAAMVGFDRLSKVAHSLENIFELFRSGVKKLNVKVIGRIISIIEDLTTLSKSVEDDIAESDRDSLINRINTIENECEDFKKDLSATKEVVKVESKPKTREEILKKADEVFEKVFTTQKTEQFTHVKLSQLDYIVSMLGELISNKNKENFRIKNMFDRFQELSYATGRLNKVVKEIEERFTYSDILGVDDEINKNSRLTDDFSLGEFDRYDIFNIYTRQLSEIANDINMSYKGIESNLYNYEDEILSISRLMDKLRKDITSIRMVHVENLFNTAIRTANTAANIEGKSVNILYSGEKIAIDQSIFDGLKESFLHLVRNAVSHGIESPEQRKLMGKNPEGTLVFRALREGNQVIFEIEDDGAGIDIEKVRNKAVEKGLLDRYEADNMRVDKLFDLLFLPGFSTKDSVGELSGRGVGLDVVKENIEKIGGYVKIYSEYGKGTKVILNINMKELIAEYLLVRENGQEFSIPLLNIVTIFYLDTKKLHKRSDGYKYDLRGELLDIYDLGVLLGQVKLGYLDSYKSCIVLSSKGKKYIIVIDEVLDRMVTITKPLPKSISHFNHFSGATIDANGSVALILDPMYLIKDTLNHNISLTIDKKDEKLQKSDYIPNSILIVDDSLSVRKYLGKLLTSYGFNYVEATDGIAAIDNLRSRKFDLIITDLEMPLMNGYELINHIRGEMLDHETPIFVLTSRATDKHRNKAMELGANDFLMKPFDEDEVISKIKEVISARVNFSK